MVSVWAPGCVPPLCWALSPVVFTPSACVPECGAAFTSKLEGMFKDMELSKDIMVQFKQASCVFVQVEQLYVSDPTLRYVKPSALKVTVLTYLSNLNSK